MISYMFEAMASPLRRSFNLSRRGHEDRGGSLDDTLAAHVAVLEAIRAGDTKAAGAAMRAHLEETERDIQKALNAAPRESLVPN